MSCALCCQFLSVSGVVILSVWGLLFINGTPIEGVPSKHAKNAGWACFGAAILYVVVFVGVTFGVMMKKPDRRASTGVPAPAYVGQATGLSYGQESRRDSTEGLLGGGQEMSSAAEGADRRSQ
uniref:Uncharacterized protein n=1 Tax=Chromera velia CCMP2878 TaxID=1169474 RepID=A0A0G4H5M9_9ALVE|mmetsp:Transcript_10363/g.20076  ORF Transcript_10363/g.20076 Transcript_10363/m.20076 type:complete len:123 (+) Transcript_10363:844-1212(+)|eukprot:Cvel_24732.t1-p1 / transcript=Cvel_24732.t1 / gene=Cvel_24732 / organism=Chromera_velia_CCMP2878 / gene_product=hypothetical protein / transcript_product=hypothetical protein / location=Cvel_scaffold2715:23912-24277(-) / protein_length=122 / sequence_SO=supercontig / SO=protein_coding / is_pseudo=false